jgi:hypothetical protein
MKTSPGKFALAATASALLLGLSCTSARAQLTPAFEWSGNGNWSLDAIGSNNSPVGNVLADVPVGSTVVKAYLYSSIYNFNVGDPSATTPDVTLGSTTYSGADWTSLPADSSVNVLDAYRADVTAQMQAAIGSGSATPFSFSVSENTNNAGTDGEVLAIVYSNPADPAVTVAFLDGSLSSTGATTTVNYASPLSGVGTPSFYAQMSIGDGFSFQDNGDQQYSEIDVNGRRLTTSAGGDDDDVGGGADGSGYNGDLITVGGIGDSTSNPDNPNATPTTNRSDDELYDLGQGDAANPTPFVSNGDTSTTITTINPSNNDNIFFLGLNITAQATVTNGTPDIASTAALMALALAATGCASLRRRKA